MEWGWIAAAPFILLAALCPLMMVGMMAMPWLMRRRGKADGGHGGHGMMMMCHGGMDHGKDSHESSSASLVDELKAERERLDQLIAKAEGERVG